MDIDALGETVEELVTTLNHYMQWLQETQQPPWLADRGNRMVVYKLAAAIASKIAQFEGE